MLDTSVTELTSYNVIKERIKDEIDKRHFSVAEKIIYSEKIADIAYMFTEFSQITRVFIDSHEKVLPSHHESIFFSFEGYNAKAKKISAYPIMLFTYFALRAHLKEKSYDAHLEYGFKIFFADNCPRFYNTNDLILNFYSFYDEYSSKLLPKTISGYRECPHKVNVNTLFYNIFDNYIDDYANHMCKFFCNEQSYYKKFLDPMLCKMFSLYDYPKLTNQDFIYSEESNMLAYEVCMDIITFISEC